ncbi:MULTISPECIES: hypothetical protein [Chitinophagaceae]
MAWYNNNNQSYGNNYNNSYGSGYGGGNRNYNNRGGNSRPQRKKSGAKAGVGKNGKPYVQGWNASRQNGMVSFLCVPTSNTGQHTSRTGRNWENWMVVVQPRMGASFLKSCLYDPSTGKCIISDMGIVLNPKAPNGGYCGRFGNKRN